MDHGYRCPSCSFRTDVATNLNDHMRTCVSSFFLPDSKEYQCDCGLYKTKLKSNFKRHRAGCEKSTNREIGKRSKKSSKTTEKSIPIELPKKSPKTPDRFLVEPPQSTRDQPSRHIKAKTLDKIKVAANPPPFGLSLRKY